MGNMESQMRKGMKRKILAVLCAAVALAVLATLGGGYYMVGYALRPVNRGKDIEGSWKVMRNAYPQLVPWVDSLRQAKALRDTFITAPDGVRLHAYYVRAARPTRHTAVVVHGYTDNAVRMMHIGHMYNQALHCNVLLPDLRYSGMSGGEAIQMGWLDRKDVMQWIGLAPRLFGDSLHVVVHGISMGAATTMMLSGEELPSYVTCFVEDCGYTSVWEQFARELKAQFHLPPFPLLYAADGICRLQYGWGFREASALGQVEKCRKPMLFIHGDKDDYVPTYMVYRLYAAKPAPKELWVVPGAAHAVSYKEHPIAYTERVRHFVQEYMDR